ncbi:DUF421 domain-containing protein [Cohnella hongkongensis]|uniref:DUF421 domain-containing protein n=1 Tax=Cohnella hongkongensis TaxID=178337 RepID=A0ABV9FLS2_9BACL
MPTWLEVTLRTIMSVAILFIITRILGKRQVSQLSLFEYITGISIGNLAAYLSLDTDTKWYIGIVALSVWVIVSYGIEIIQLKSKRTRDFLDGTSTVFMKNGKILEDNLREERVSSDELMEMLRKNNVFDVSKVDFAIMDASGELNVQLKKEYQPLTPSDVGLSVSPEKYNMAVIMDGKIMEDSLKKIGLNRAWLEHKLQQLGISMEKIYFAQVNSQNKLYIDPYEDSFNER